MAGIYSTIVFLLAISLPGFSRRPVCFSGTEIPGCCAGAIPAGAATEDFNNDRRTDIAIADIAYRNKPGAASGIFFARKYGQQVNCFIPGRDRILSPAGPAH